MIIEPVLRNIKAPRMQVSLNLSATNDLDEFLNYDSLKEITKWYFLNYWKRELMDIGIRPRVIKFRTKDGKRSIKLSTLSLDTILNKLYV